MFWALDIDEPPNFTTCIFKIDLQTIEIIKNEIKEEADDAEDDLELVTGSDSGDYGVLSENDFETGEGFIENE